MRQKHGLLLFLTSCVPGCGEMYQGYMKRGMSILTIFCGIFALAVFLEIGALAVLMLPVWLFSFFDSYNLRAQAEADAAPPDGYLFGLSDVDSRQMSALLQKRHSLVGWGLVAVGVYIFYSTVADWVVDFFCQFFDAWWLDRVLSYDVPRLAVTVGIIALGVWFIRGPKREKSEDIPAFTPPEAEPVREEAADSAAEQEDGHGEH
nr:hypothetical protein [uncultured Oscillibacter sp.]